MRRKIVLAVAAVLLFSNSTTAGEIAPFYGATVKAEAKELTTEKLVVTPEDLAEEHYYDSLELLAIMVEAEAGNQSELGKRLVVDTVLNRVDSPDFPDSIWEVITQKNAFSSYTDGGMDRVWEPAESTYRAVETELTSRVNYEVLYFSSGGYSKYGTAWEQVGDHYFSTK